MTPRPRGMDCSGVSQHFAELLASLSLDGQYCSNAQKAQKHQTLL